MGFFFLPVSKVCCFVFFRLLRLYWSRSRPSNGCTVGYGLDESPVHHGTKRKQMNIGMVGEEHQRTRRETTQTWGEHADNPLEQSSQFVSI